MSTVSKVKPKTAECIRHVQLQATGKAKRCFTLNAVAPHQQQHHHHYRHQSSVQLTSFSCWMNLEVSVQETSTR